MREAVINAQCIADDHLKYIQAGDIQLAHCREIAERDGKDYSEMKAQRDSWRDYVAKLFGVAPSAMDASGAREALAARFLDLCKPGHEAEETLDRTTIQRDTAWLELRQIRETIGANPEESTLDEVIRLVFLMRNRLVRATRSAENRLDLIRDGGRPMLIDGGATDQEIKQWESERSAIEDKTDCTCEDGSGISCPACLAKGYT
jgi:hypothetical protein